MSVYTRHPGLRRLRDNLAAIRDAPEPDPGEAERAAAATLRRSSELLHAQADAAEQLGERERLRLQAVEAWAAADGLVAEELI